MVTSTGMGEKLTKVWLVSLSEMISVDTYSQRHRFMANS